MTRHAVSSGPTQANFDTAGPPFTGAGQVSPTFSNRFPPFFNVSLWGTFVASVQLERCIDGVNWLPLTAAGIQLYVWTGPASESAEEDQPNVEYRLRCTAFTSGSVSFLISQ